MNIPFGRITRCGWNPSRNRVGKLLQSTSETRGGLFVLERKLGEVSARKSSLWEVT